MSSLNQVYQQINEQVEIMKVNHEHFVLKGNKQAAKRARVAGGKIKKLIPKYRACSVTLSGG